MKNSKKLIASATCAVVLRNLNADKHHNKSRPLSTAVSAEYRKLGGTTESQWLSSENYRDSQQWWLPKKSASGAAKAILSDVASTTSLASLGIISTGQSESWPP